MGFRLLAKQFGDSVGSSQVKQQIITAFYFHFTKETIVSGYFKDGLMRTHVRDTAFVKDMSHGDPSNLKLILYRIDMERRVAFIHSFQGALRFVEHGQQVAVEEQSGSRLSGKDARSRHLAFGWESSLLRRRL